MSENTGKNEEGVVEEPKDVNTVEDSKEAIEEQEGVDFVVCKICGKRLRRVNDLHLRQAHGITLFDYMKKFPDAKIVADVSKIRGAIERTKERVPRQKKVEEKLFDAFLTGMEKGDLKQLLTRTFVRALYLLGGAEWIKDYAQRSPNSAKHFLTILSELVGKEMDNEAAAAEGKSGIGEIHIFSHVPRPGDVAGGSDKSLEADGEHRLEKEEPKQIEMQIESVNDGEAQAD